MVNNLICLEVKNVIVIFLILILFIFKLLIKASFSLTISQGVRVGRLVLILLVNNIVHQ